MINGGGGRGNSGGRRNNGRYNERNINSDTRTSDSRFSSNGQRSKSQNQEHYKVRFPSDSVGKQDNSLQHLHNAIRFPSDSNKKPEASWNPNAKDPTKESKRHQYPENRSYSKNTDYQESNNRKFYREKPFQKQMENSDLNALSSNEEVNSFSNSSDETNDTIDDISHIDPFELFCAYHLGITREGFYKPASMSQLAYRFSVSPKSINHALTQFNIDTKFISSTSFDIHLAKMDIRLSPRGVSKKELARTIYQDFIRAKETSALDSANLSREEANFDSNNSTIEDSEPKLGYSETTENEIEHPTQYS